MRHRFSLVLVLVLLVALLAPGALAAPILSANQWLDHFADAAGLVSTTDTQVLGAAGQLALAASPSPSASYVGSGTALSAIINPMVAVVRTPTSFEVGATIGSMLYLLDAYGDSRLFVFDPAFESIRLLRTMPLGSASLVAGRDGKLYLGAGKNLYSYDPATEALTDLGVTWAGGESITGLAVAPGGLIYGTTQHQFYAEVSTHLFSYNPTTRGFADLAAFSTEAKVHTVTANGRVYGSGGYASVNSGMHIWEYDPISGWPEDLGGVLGLQSVNVLVAGHDGRLYSGTNTNDGSSGALFVFDPQSKSFTNLTPSYGTRPTGGVYALAVGPDGRIHGGARKNGWVPYMFTYDPMADSFIDTGRVFPEGHIGWAGWGPDGRVYATAYGYGAVTEALLEYSPALGGFDTWDRVEFGATLPTGTGIRIDVLDDLGNTLLSNVASGASLAGVSRDIHPALQLRASLRGPGAATPLLDFWSVSWKRSQPESCQPTIEAVSDGEWDRATTWSGSRIPNVADTVRIQAGLTVDGPTDGRVRALCNYGTIRARAGATMRVRAGGAVFNYGNITGMAGAEGMGETCGQAGGSIEISGTPLTNQGIMVAGKGGSGASCGGNGGTAMIYGTDTTNHGTICGGRGGDVVGTSPAAHAGAGGETHIWGKWFGPGTLTNVGLACGGDGGDANPGSGVAQQGGNGGRLKLISLPNVFLGGGKHYGGNGGKSSQGSAGVDGAVIIEPRAIALSGIGTEVRGGDVTIFGGDNWTLDFRGLKAGTIMSTGNLTLAVGAGGIINLRGSEPGALQSAGLATVAGDTVLLDDGKQLGDYISAAGISAGPASCCTTSCWTVRKPLSPTQAAPAPPVSAW